MKLIVVPTDFSPLADNALKYGIDLATAMGSSLMIVHVYQIPISYSEVPLITVSIEEIKKASEDRLAEIKHNIETITAGKLVVYTESRLGDVGDEINKLTKTLQPFAVVMGSRGVTGAGKFFLGSNSLSVISRTNTPVIVVPPGGRFLPYKKIGLTTDFKEVINKTPVVPIRALVSFFNAELHVLHVDYKQRNFNPDVPEQTLNLDMLLTGMNPTYDFIENKDVNEGINDFAEKNNIDLIVTLPQKHSFLESLFEKSLTRELLHHTHIPVMCIKNDKVE
ncbi:MAG: universal stress protein [Chitinophagaceae bacterium]|jgi:nucleotide-binding universal stress UspA family protein